MNDKETRPLSSIKDGETVTLASVDVGQVLNSRLASMGLLPNVELTVVSNGHPGPFMISVKDCKMMLGRGIAHKIMVI